MFLTTSIRFHVQVSQKTLWSVYAPTENLVLTVGKFGPTNQFSSLSEGPSLDAVGKPTLLAPSHLFFTP